MGEGPDRVQALLGPSCRRRLSVSLAALRPVAGRVRPRRLDRRRALVDPTARRGWGARPYANPRRRIYSFSPGSRDCDDRGVKGLQRRYDHPPLRMALDAAAETGQELYDKESCIAAWHCQASGSREARENDSKTNARSTTRGRHRRRAGASRCVCYVERRWLAVSARSQSGTAQSADMSSPRGQARQRRLSIPLHRRSGRDPRRWLGSVHCCG